MQFEIKREDLLKLKQTNYELYQLIMSQKSLDGDYCETLDKEKLAKECELGYFKIDELFTKEQIANAYKNIEKRVEDNAGKVLKAYSIDAIDFVRGYSLAEEIKKAAREDLTRALDIEVDVKPAEEEGAYKVSVSLPEFYGHRTIEQEIKMIDSAIISGAQTISGLPQQKKHANLIKAIKENKSIWTLASVNEIESIRNEIKEESSRLTELIDLKLTGIKDAKLKFAAFYFYGNDCGWDRIENCCTTGLNYCPINDTFPK